MPLTAASAVLAATMVASLDPRPGARQVVLFPMRALEDAPSPLVGPLLASAACPLPPVRLELAVLQGTRCLGRLRDGKGCLVARRLVAGFEVNERSRAVVPLHRLMPAGVVVRMAVAHGSGWSAQDVSVVLLSSGPTAPRHTSGFVLYPPRDTRVGGRRAAHAGRRLPRSYRVSGPLPDLDLRGARLSKSTEYGDISRRHLFFCAIPMRRPAGCHRSCWSGWNRPCRHLQTRG